MKLRPRSSSLRSRASANAWGLALAILGLAFEPCPAAEPYFEQTPVFKAGEGGYEIYRIPGLVVTPRGTLLAYCEARKSAKGDWNAIDLFLRRSSNGGRTWDPPLKLVNPPPGFPKNEAALEQKLAEPGETTCNNPVAIPDGRNDAVHLLYGLEYARCYYRVSRDDGRSFSEPVDITATFEAFRDRYPWKVLATGPGHGIQLKASGRLVVPVWLSTGTGGHAHRPSAVATIYSDDFGKTWLAGEIVAVDSEQPELAAKMPSLKNPSETAIVELADGRVMLNIRHEGEERLRAVTVSPDGATGWSPLSREGNLPEPVCMASLARLSAEPGDDKNRLLFSNPLNKESKERKNVAVQLSYDEGKTWSVHRTIEPGPSGYSDLAVNPTNGEIYCFYERGKKEQAFQPASLTLARFNLEWLSEGKDTLEGKDSIGGTVRVPRKQSAPPGPPLSAEEAAKKMTVPEGFSVEVVAAEPDVVNPIGMAIDEKGRFWITESFEYPRHEAGPGRDRIKVLEDTDHDGKVDKVTIFAEGLNIPSGIAVGHGGVWVANAPDILFLQDTDGDLKADKREVIVTGFGRTDTHELPNSLTWGPDGWLYGLNGVFNYCKVEHRGKTHDFTCVMFRINPRKDTEGPWKGTHDFQIFAEGTSNPWGIAWDENGSAFLSACVIEHLWHIVQSGYYHRQGGPYPPHTWKLESIVDHQHQMAAYCGITWFDSDAYPEEYRRHLYMGNIHGGCVNVDTLERRGASYFGKPRPDFVTANDVWHMPVVQKTGPDGCLYVLDWYDRYHCYQDANADPEGVDRDRGRLYRIRYKETPRAGAFDMAEEDDAALVRRLHSQNVYTRETAQRLLAERATPESGKLLGELLKDEAAPRHARMHALWSLLGQGSLEDARHLWLLGHGDPWYRAWAIRAAGNQGRTSDAVAKTIASLAGDPSVDVRLQVAIAATRVEGLQKEAPALLAECLSRAGHEMLISNIVWQNLHPLLEARPDQIDRLLARLEGDADLAKKPAALALLPRLAAFLLDRPEPKLAPFARTFRLLHEREDLGGAGECLTLLAGRVRSGEIKPDALAAVKEQLAPGVTPVLDQSGSPLRFAAAQLAAVWGDARAVEIVSGVLAEGSRPLNERVEALDTLAKADPAAAREGAEKILADSKAGADLKARVLGALGKLDAPEIGALVVKALPSLPPALTRDAIELLTQRGPWSLALIEAVKAGQIDQDVVNPLQAGKMAASGDAKVREAAAGLWGQFRQERNPEREATIQKTKELVARVAGDWKRGEAAFQKACAACHIIHGKGHLIGPDLSVTGRGSLDQLLSNMLDPNLVIGNAYQARLVQTKDGRAIMGIPVEDNAQRLVLRPPAGADETIPRDAVAQVTTLPVSLMPEGLEKALTEKELVDLVFYLAHDKHPSDASAVILPGVVAP